MTYRYFVTYKHAAGDMDSTEIVVDRELDSAVGRIKAEEQLAARGVTSPHITGWALRSATDQEKC